jgi:hypothetical protein
MLLTPTNASCCALQGFNVQPAPQYCVILSTLQMASMPSLICCAAFDTATSQISVGTIREQTIPSLCLNHLFCCLQVVICNDVDGQLQVRDGAANYHTRPLQHPRGTFAAQIVLTKHVTKGHTSGSN